MTRLIALPIVILSLVSPAAAQQKPAAADRQTIQKCLGPASGGDARSCIGRIADPCINRVKDADDAVTKSKECAARELAVWEEQLAAAVKQVNAGGFKPISTTVAEAQKAFVVSREKLCSVFDKIDPGMSLGGADYCRLQETAQRALILRGLGDALGEH